MKDEGMAQSDAHLRGALDAAELKLMKLATPHSSS
jgi:hypothetical protein